MFIQTYTNQIILFPSLKKNSVENSTDCDLEEKYFEEKGFSDFSNSFENLSQ